MSFCLKTDSSRSLTATTSFGCCNCLSTIILTLGISIYEMIGLLVTPLPKPIPETSYTCFSEVRFSLFKAKGKLSKLSTSVYQLDGTPSSHFFDKPSISNNMLCMAQQGSHSLSQALYPDNLTPYLRYFHLPFRIPKAHSISFLMLSN